MWCIIILCKVAYFTHTRPCSYQGMNCGNWFASSGFIEKKKMMTAIDELAMKQAKSSSAAGKQKASMTLSGR